ncbi:MAG TPA: excinuclease ABC subunit UvrA [Candidatus Pacearchaeota archaeon]|nr:excinuclease ABC subunit UvrA [Candidatus Parcubacteria bacterium]HOU45534.1 excinuclease ABC subunit UvrA [Candidatus Pacearchaeota archaeon]HPM08579.1 excinuclease ABC subunit UvrA [Candidatus Pacearchaeota archaeon]HQI74308.1 excinuclease ABC subunit UvrA [Candidatus Pacearchaeota archaeon]
MESDHIILKGVRENNLKNISLNIPKNKLVAICGLSGSGKSSLVFDTIYAEGQRRYLESLSSYARQFLGGISKPDVDKIESLSPTIAVNQKTISANPRSTVGTITEIYDYLRLLFTHIGEAYCPNCNIPLASQNVLQITDKIYELVKTKPIAILAPVVVGQKGEHKGIFEEIYRSGWPRVRIDGIFYNTSEAMQKGLDKNKKHTIQVLIDEFDFQDYLKVMGSFENKKSSKAEREAAKTKKQKIKNLLSDEKDRILQASRKASEMGQGRLIALDKKNDKEYLFSELSACIKCDFSMPKIEPRFFSFNSPYGACTKCQGLGRILKINPQKVVNPRLSLNEGAILPLGSWGKYMQRLIDVAIYESKINELGFSLDTPFGELPQNTQDVILYGNDEFEGIIGRMERLYHQTSSEYVREEIGKYMNDLICPECQGARLKREVLAVKINGMNINDIVSVPVKEAMNLLEDSFLKLKESKQKVAQPILKEIYARFEFLRDVGVDYISLGRQSGTLSVGENQRIRLACQLGSGLSGIVYILDEPTVGLHQRDTDRLIKSVRKLVDLGNTVLVVEHDENVIKAADWIIEIGPESGIKGGKVVFEGTPKQLEKADTLTGKYFSKRLSAKTDFEKIEKETPFLELKGASEFNIKNLDLKVPLQKFVCVAGVSGAGKSTLVLDILAKALQYEVEKKQVVPGEYKELFGKDNLNRVIVIDQSPIGRTPRSNPATYTGVFTFIRDLFAQSQEAKMFGFKSGHFSFNTKYGRCPACWGEGVKKVEMYFLPDIYVPCEVCKGKRFTPEILKVLYNGKNIADVLDMSVDDAKNFFSEIPHIFRKLNTLSQIGLGYIKLGQSSTELSGGESQRIKLSEELSKRDTGKTIYILDEPTTGLHFHDVKKLMQILRKLVEKGNSVLVIEHNLDVIKEADWIIEMGPEGGKEGGKIVFQGTIDKLKKQKTPTAKYL